MGNYEQILETKVAYDVINESFELGEKMLGKYADFSTLMGLEPEEYADMKALYALAVRFKDEAVKSIKQQNLQSEMIYDLTGEVRDLCTEIALLREEINSLKSSKAKKTLDDFKKGIGLEEVEEE